MSGLIRQSRKVSAVATMLKCSQVAVHRLIASGHLQCFRIGGRKYVYLDTVESYQRDINPVVSDDKVVK